MAKKYWNDHLSNFNLEDSGEYRYDGAFYALVGDYKRITLRFGLVAVLIFVSIIAAGFQPATGAMDTWYVVLPFGLTFLMSGIVLYKILTWANAVRTDDYSIKGVLSSDEDFPEDFSYNKDGTGLLREYKYDKTVPKIPGLLIALMVFAAITFVDEVFYLITHGKGEHFTGAIVLVFAMALVAGLSLYLLRGFKGQKWLKLQQNSPLE